jgi:hypothetical protein
MFICFEFLMCTFFPILPPLYYILFPRTSSFHFILPTYISFLPYTFLYCLLTDSHARAVESQLVWIVPEIELTVGWSPISHRLAGDELSLSRLCTLPDQFVIQQRSWP